MPTPEREARVTRLSSMRHWFPRLESTGVPVPKTEWVEIRSRNEASEFTEGPVCPDTTAVQKAIEAVGGPPAFIRSDQASDKHRMARASRVTDLGDEHVSGHVFKMLSHNELAGFTGLPHTHLAVREWLNLRHEFTAFDHTPVAAEVRVFLHQGEVHSHGFYWPEAAIKDHPVHNDGDGLVGAWRDARDATEEHALAAFDEDVQPLAEEVATEFDEGYWSVDFAETVGGEWVAIDMAVGEASWYPDGCEKPASDSNE